MLTWDELELHRMAGRLVRWPKNESPTALKGRCLYMLPTVYEDFVKKPWPQTQYIPMSVAKARRQAMRAVLLRFVNGHFIACDDDLKELGTKRGDAQMQGFFSFRSGMPMEQTRLLGFFARPGAFVALSFRSRGYFEPDDGSDPQIIWNSERSECEGKWRALFEDAEYMKDPWPVSANAINAYLGGPDEA